MGERRQHVDDLAHEAAPQGFVAVHQLLGADEIARRAAFDHVAGHGEGGAHEADHGHAAGQGAHHQLDRLAHVAEFVGVGGGERIHVVRGADGIADHRTFALLVAQLEAHRLHRKQQVREDDGRIHIQRFHRLQRDGRRQVGPLAHFEDPVLLADLAVLLHVAAGLPHEPHRPHIGGPAPAGV